MATKAEDAITIARETRDRTRRIETRLVKFMLAQGLDTQVQQPQWDAGTVHIHSISTALIDILDVIPETWGGPVEVYLDTTHVMTLRTTPSN